MKQAVIYEVRLEIDPEIEHELDAWLAGHIAEMLRFDGFVSADILVPEPEVVSGSAPNPPAEGGGANNATDPDTVTPSIVRIVQYEVLTHEHLDRYFREHAGHMRQQGVQRFGNAFSASRSIYEKGARPARSCQNCGEGLRGQYCEECGQRDKHRIISLWELLRDLIGDVFELDSRVWRTMFPLLFKPGRLTTEYLRGRRVHYTPPLRLYLITSLVFFLVVFFNTDPDINFNGGPDDIAEAIAALEDAGGDAEDVAKAIEVFRNASGDPEKIAEAIAILENTSGDSAEIGKAIRALKSQSDDSDSQDSVTEPVSVTADDSATVPDTEAESDSVPETGSGSLTDNCDEIEIGDAPWADAVETRARQACRNLTTEGGAKRFVGDLIDNAPAMMFFFLPVVALIMVFLYPLSRRYYVEHLLFFVHFHSFFFLILTLTVLIARMPAVLPGQAGMSNLLSTVVTFYIPIYLFVAMRRVYGQSRAVTALKYGVLGVAYFVSLLFSFAAMALFTALST